MYRRDVSALTAELHAGVQSASKHIEARPLHDGRAAYLPVLAVVPALWNNSDSYWKFSTKPNQGCPRRHLNNERLALQFQILRRVRKRNCTRSCGGPGWVASFTG